MVDSAWIEAMHDELHQFDRLKVGTSRQTIWQDDYKAKVEVVLISKNNLHQLLAWKRRFMLLSQMGSSDPDHPDKKVYLLRKALYGFKTSSRAWYDETFPTSDVPRLYKRCIDTRKRHFRGIQFLGDKLSKLDVKETELHCNVFSRGRVRALYQQVSASSNVDLMRTRLKIMLQYTIYRCIVTLSQP
ncbi:hypothetical protein Tco_1201486 [Tanacetum coccineum]